MPKPEVAELQAVVREAILERSRKAKTSQVAPQFKTIFQAEAREVVRLLELELNSHFDDEHRERLEAMLADTRKALAAASTS